MCARWHHLHLRLPKSERDQWAKQIEMGSVEVKEFARIGCKYAGRCPHVMEICHSADPPDVEVQGRTVKCYLYTEEAAAEN